MRAYRAEGVARSGPTECALPFFGFAGFSSIVRWASAHPSLCIVSCRADKQRASCAAHRRATTVNLRLQHFRGHSPLIHARGQGKPAWESAEVSADAVRRHAQTSLELLATAVAVGQRGQATAGQPTAGVEVHTTAMLRLDVAVLVVALLSCPHVSRLVASVDTPWVFGESRRRLASCQPVMCPVVPL